MKAGDSCQMESRVYGCRMIKTIFIWVVIIIVIIGGVFAYIKYGKASTPAMTDQAQQQATTTPQVQGQDVTVGTGAVATPGSVVSVLYVGALADGTVFDSSAAHGNTPLEFTLGAQGLIPGFQIGVNGMRVGGERKIAIPPELGYGMQDVKDASGKVIIPANSTIIFDVKLVKVSAAPAATSTTPKTK